LFIHIQSTLKRKVKQKDSIRQIILKIFFNPFFQLILLSTIKSFKANLFFISFLDASQKKNTGLTGKGRAEPGPA